MLGVLVLLCLATPLAAAEFVVVGQITELAGRVKLERDGKVEDAMVGSTLAASDTLRTNAKGRVRITLSAGAVMTIGPESRVRLTEVVKQNEGLVSAVIDLLRGIARFALAPDPKRERFSVQTRTALVSVRSTRWVVVSDRDDHAAVFVIEGRVEAAGRLAANAGQVTLEAGQGADISDRAIKGPKTWGQGRVDGVLARTTL